MEKKRLIIILLIGLNVLIWVLGGFSGAIAETVTKTVKIKTPNVEKEVSRKEPVAEKEEREVEPEKEEQEEQEVTFNNVKLKDCQVPIDGTGVWESCAEAKADTGEKVVIVDQDPIPSSNNVKLKDCQVPIDGTGIWESCAEAKETASPPVKDCQVPIGDSGVWESCEEAKNEAAMSQNTKNNQSGAPVSDTMGKQTAEQQNCTKEVGNSGVFEGCESGSVVMKSANKVIDNSPHNNESNSENINMLPEAGVNQSLLAGILILAVGLFIYSIRKHLHQKKKFETFK